MTQQTEDNDVAAAAEDIDVAAAADSADDAAAADSADDAAAADSADDAAETAGTTQADSRGGESLLVREGDIAADYLERLLDILDYDGDIDLDVEGDRAVVAVVGGSLRGLIGTDGATLDALQELTRLAVTQQTGGRTRLMLDVGGFRAKRRTELSELALRTATEVRERGTSSMLAPMNPFERKVVHDALSTVDGVHTESEGEEPNRCVVVLPGA